MASNFIEKAVYTIAEAFQNCLKRFPVTVCFVFALTGHLIYLCASDGKVPDDKLFYTISYYFSVGTLLSLTLHLWSEEMKRKAAKAVTHLTGHLLLLADTFFLYTLSPEQSWTEIIIAHAAAILALGLSVFFLSFFREKNDVPSWNFALSSLGSFVTANVMGSIMSGGICLLLFSLHQLFNLDIKPKGYGYILILCNVLLAMMLFLGLLPKGEAKHDRKPLVRSFLNTAAHYLFLPLTGAYLLVLYVYAAKILISWELPDGWVSWLVTALMTGCIAIEFSIYPTRMALSGRWDERIARWLPVLVLPLLVLMSVGIVRRLNDYGITVNRLYLATFNAWCYAVCIGLFVTRARRINWIPISFAATFLLTSALPVNFASITRRTLRHDIEQLTAQVDKDKLPFSNRQYEEWLNTLPRETATDVNDKLAYMRHTFGRESIRDIVAEDVYFYDKVETASERSHLLVCSFDETKPMEIPEGYTRFIGDSQDTFFFSAEECRTGTLAVPLNRWIENSEDSISINIKTLEEWDKKEESGNIPPARINSKSGNHVFYITYFCYDPKQGNGPSLQLSGYLFMK